MQIEASGAEAGEDLACYTWLCTLVHFAVWIGHSLICCFAAIWLTAKIAPQAACYRAPPVGDSHADVCLCAGWH